MTLAIHAASIMLGGRRVLKDISSAVKPGEFVAVVGPNGAGKSTLLKAMAGLMPLESGHGTLDGAALKSFSRRHLAKQIAYLPQDRTVHWALAAARVVGLGRLPHRSFAAGESAADRAIVAAAMTRMDVIQFCNRPVTTLSGGELARVLLARALAQEARYLIADEPAAGLDPAHSLALFQEFVRLAEDGHAVIAAMHDLSFAMRFATRVILLKDGACLSDGLPAKVLSRDNLATAFAIDAIVTMVDGVPVVLPRTPLKRLTPLT